MRQSGIIAAAGLHALHHHIPRLAQDHHNARLLATLRADLPGITIDPDHTQTNIVLFTPTSPHDTPDHFTQRLLHQTGVRVSSLGDVIRAVTHLDLTTTDIHRAAHHIGTTLTV